MSNQETKGNQSEKLDRRKEGLGISKEGRLVYNKQVAKHIITAHLQRCFAKMVQYLHHRERVARAVFGKRMFQLTFAFR